MNRKEKKRLRELANIPPDARWQQWKRNMKEKFWYSLSYVIITCRCKLGLPVDFRHVYQGRRRR